MKPVIAFLAPLLAAAVAAAGGGARRVTVPANRVFTDTGIDLKKGEALRIEASGEMEIDRPRYGGRDGYDYRVGPRGTYRYPDKVEDEHFPLPAAQRGPAPCYCLIGKIGTEGTPFYVGAAYEGEVPAGGRLFLGVNDFDVADNSGGFTAEISTGGDAAAPRRGPGDVVHRAADLPEGAPTPGADVVLIYVDGLRYDVLREMAKAGHLPHIKEYFLDGGTDFANAVTGFPSSTLASNATMYTGVFPNRSGIKGNTYFDRKRLRGHTRLEPFAPPLSADVLRPSGLHHLGVLLKKGFLRLYPPACRRYLEKRSEDVPLLQDIVRERGMTFYTTVKPIHPESPPARYELDGCNVVPPLKYHHAVDYADRINARYGRDLVIQPDARVMSFWFPNVDTSGHDSPRAQFGGSRRSIARLDGIIGEIIAELERKKMRDRTYLILVADHGTAGGKSHLIQKVDLGRELFHRLPADADGNGVPDPGSGLGWNARWYDDSYRRRGWGRKSFVFLDHGEGVSRIYLPHRRIDSGDWLTRNTLHDLTHYGVGSGGGEVDLVDRLLSFDLGAQNLYPGEVAGRPVGMVLLKLDGNRVAVAGQGGRNAVIERREKKGGGYEYRYVPASAISMNRAGEVTIEEASDSDPFGYLGAGIPLAWLTAYHSDREWLERTKGLRRPDAVVAVAAQMFWDGKAAERERRYSPDMIAVAARGWSFERPEEPSGAHGYLDYETMKIPFFVTGPNVRRGVILTDPVRTADIVPTVLALLGSPAPEGLDGVAVRGFLQSSPAEKLPPGTSAAELLASLPYPDERTAAADIVADYERRRAEKNPRFLIEDTRYEGHDLERPTDIHNIGADILSVFNWEVFTALDAVFDAAYPGDRKRPINTAFDKTIAWYDTLPDRYPKERVRELVFALQVREITAGEVPSLVLLSVGGLTGRGVFLRVSLLLRWMEHLCSDADRALLFPVKNKNIKVVRNFNYLLKGLRIGVDKVSWGIAYYVGDIVYDAVYHLEKGNEKIVRHNLPAR